MTRRILILNWRDIKNPKCGGGDFMIHKVAKFLVDSGYQVDFFCSIFPHAKQNEKIDGIDVIRKGSELFLPITGFIHYLKNRKKKFSLILEIINVIPWFVPIYFKRNHIAHIHQTQIQYNDKTKISAISVEINVFMRNVIFFLEKLIPIFYKKTTFVTLSESTKKDMISLGLFEKNVTVISPGIEEVNTKYYDVNKKKEPTIVYVGRLRKYKGVQYLLKSFSSVILKHPSSKLVIIGKGDYEQELKKQILDLNLSEQVEMLGFVSEPEKNAIIRSAWMLVIPSLNEGWCIPVIEAGQLGVTTIAFNNGGLNDSVQNNKTGFLVESENTMELTEKILALIESEELRNSLGKNAQIYSKKFLWKNQLQKYLETIEKFMS